MLMLDATPNSMHFSQLAPSGQGYIPGMMSVWSPIPHWLVRFGSPSCDPSQSVLAGPRTVAQACDCPLIPGIGMGFAGWLAGLSQDSH